MTFLAILLGILIILFLITLHEVGHFVMAKIFKVYIYEFSIGIGPKIFKWKGKETQYSIRLLPFGGYVFTASEYLDPPDSHKNVEIEDHRYIEKVNRFKQLLIIFSGVLMNFNIAIILFTLIFSITKCSPNDINGYGASYYQESDSPAYVLGLNNKNVKNPYVITEIAFIKADDSDNKNYQLKYDNYKNKINEKNTHIISTTDNLLNFYDSAMKLQSILKINNNEKNNSIFVKYDIYNYKTEKLDPISGTNDGWYDTGYHYLDNTKYKFKNDYYIIGMQAPDYYFASASKAYSYGWKKMFQDSVLILKAFGKLFTGQWQQLSGPVGTIEQTKSFVNSGPEEFFLYVATLSANLFVLNLIPIPPLDGFKFMIVFIEMCIRRELNQKVKLFVTILGLVLFIILFFGLTIKDLFL